MKLDALLSGSLPYPLPVKLLAALLSDRTLEADRSEGSTCRIQASNT